MIYAYGPSNRFKAIEIDINKQSSLDDFIWLDVVSPNADEEKFLENILDINIPTLAEMQEIELSNRFYKEDNAIFMTITMVADSDSVNPISDAISFILNQNKLITVRYIEPKAFTYFIKRLINYKFDDYSPNGLLIELLEAVVNRLADITEKVSRYLDNYSLKLFRKAGIKGERLNYSALLQGLGANGDLNTKVQDSLMTLFRMITFYEQVYFATTLEFKAKIAMLTKDTTSLRDNVLFLSNKINFLLDATLGMVNIEQNNIIKIFSIAAVIFLPPTLVASIYGMNFKLMPELNWHYGYPVAISLMLLSAWLPYKYFKMKKWL